MLKIKFRILAVSLSKLNSHTVRLIILVALLMVSLIFPGIAMAIDDPGSGGSGT